MISLNSNTFKEENFGILDMSSSELDNIFINNKGVVGSLTGAYSVRDRNVEDLTLHGWGVRWIRTH